MNPHVLQRGDEDALTLGEVARGVLGPVRVGVDVQEHAALTGLGGQRVEVLRRGLRVEDARLVALVQELEGLLVDAVLLDRRVVTGAFRLEEDVVLLHVAEPVGDIAGGAHRGVIPVLEQGTA